MSVTASGNREEYLHVSEEEDPETSSKWGKKKKKKNPLLQMLFIQFKKGVL